MNLTPHPLEIFYHARNGKPGCLFCEPIEGMVLEETQNFRVLIDTFPITSGHVMISSKAHYGSAGEVPLELFDELCELKRRVKKELASLYGHTICYEHGPGGCCSSSDPDAIQCEHFHFHCLPLNLSIAPELMKRFEKIELNDYREIIPYFFEHGNYLYCEDPSGKMMFFPAEDEIIEPHLLRTLISRALGSPDLSDWESYEDPGLFLKSYELVTNLMDFSDSEVVCDLLG